jgi:hypothetical protein
MALSNHHEAWSMTGRLLFGNPAARRVVAGVLLLLALLAGSSDAAAAGCKKLTGKFTLTPVAGAECASPVGVCTAGAFSGVLTGTSAFTGSSLTPTADTAATSVMVLTGDTVLQTNDGMLQTKDAVVLRTTGAGDFAEVDTVVAGDGAFTGATGVIRAHGTFTAAAGGEGEYAGEVCTP